MLLHLCLTALLGLGQANPPETPDAAVARLIETDRRFSTEGSQKTALESISAMLAGDATVPAPGNVFVQGRAKAMEALKANPDNLTSRLEWSPIRGGLSADGLHGFTFGFMTMTKPDGSAVPLKYLAYWVKGPDGWRVAAYRRRPRGPGEVSTALLAPSLPARIVAPSSDTARAAGFEKSLAAAEKAFSDEAQRIGIGAAFAKHGRADAVNMGGPQEAGFVMGAEAIGRSVGAGSPTDRSDVEWSADRVLVASSGDLGVTFGMIRVLKPQPGQPAAFPFFTIWRRDSATGAWKYIAE